MIIFGKPKLNIISMSCLALNHGGDGPLTFSHIIMTYALQEDRYTGIVDSTCSPSKPQSSPSDGMMRMISRDIVRRTGMRG